MCEGRGREGVVDDHSAPERTSKPFPWELMEPAPIGTPGEACAKVVEREMGTVTAPVVASGSCREEGNGREVWCDVRRGGPTASSTKGGGRR